MRHATDSDHVVAVTTIVSRQRQIGTAAMTGIFWGIGHSITLLVVGGAIILFGVVIPERLGMGLEFCVALMLILLGWLNLRAFRRSVDSVFQTSMFTNISIDTEISFTAIRTGITRKITGTLKAKCRPPVLIDALVGRTSIVSSGRSSWALCTVWLALLLLRYSSCPLFAIQSGPCSTSWSLASAR
jgi:High-affinity nickel permease